MKKAVGKPNSDEFALQSSRGTARAVDEENPLCATPRVILSREQEASVPKPEGRPPLAVGSRGGCRNVTFMWHVIARFQLASPAKWEKICKQIGPPMAVEGLIFGKANPSASYLGTSP